MHRKLLFGKMWQSIEWNRLNAIACLVVFVVLSIGCRARADDAANLPPNADNGQTNVETLKALVVKFETKYKSTLMNRAYAPFLADCINSTKLLPDTNLCATYFDMIYNIVDLSGFETAEEIERTIHDFDNASIASNFCTLFPGEVGAKLSKHPFTDALGKDVAKDLQEVVCVQQCLYISSKQVLTIKPICKLISGGCRFITLSNRTQNVASSSNVVVAPPALKANSTLVQSNVNTGKVATETQEKETNLQPKDPASKTSVSSEPKASIVDKASLPSAVSDKKSPAIAAKESDTANALSVVPNNLNNDGPDDDTVGGEAEQSEDAVNEQTLDEQKVDNVDTDNVDIPDNEDKQEELPAVHKVHGPDVLPNRFEPKNSNSQHSRLSASVKEFRDDADPSFFSYFMFVMLGVIFVYVAYHNKSKILALLIEGRRSRTYSSRNGSRRKAHSAEYRKLDSNLEEAIQSGGGTQVLTSPIIY